MNNCKPTLAPPCTQDWFPEVDSRVLKSFNIYFIISIVVILLLKQSEETRVYK